MKKTKKYFRDQINSSYSNACSVFREAMEKYGEKRKTRGWRDAKIERVGNEWNGDIVGFCYNVRKNELIVEIYWQGDSTDGNDCVVFDRSGIVLPAESYWDGYRTREDHSDVRFDQDELYQAMKNFAVKYLN